MDDAHLLQYMRVFVVFNGGFLLFTYFSVVPIGPEINLPPYMMAIMMTFVKFILHTKSIVCSGSYTSYLFLLSAAPIRGVATADLVVPYHPINS